jgi:alanine dehydrogenase
MGPVAVERAKPDGAERTGMSEVQFLSSEELDGLATPAEYVDAVQDGYRQRGEGAPARPRTRLDSDNPRGFLTGYTAILPESGAMGGYMYAAGFGSNDAHFALPLFDAGSGEILAVLDGASLNPYKTGAAGAVGVDALARADADTLGIVGSGSQARGQLLATATVREFDTVCVFSPTQDSRESFAASMDDRLEPTVGAVDSGEAAVRGSDVVITATTASEPVIDSEWLDPGTHVTAMGQYNPEKRELDSATVAQAAYIPDLRARIHRDAGSYLGALRDGAIDEGHVHAELGDVVAGEAPGRTTADEITVFDSGGTGIETVAAAKLLYDRACEESLGKSVTFTPASQAFE